MKIRKVLAGLVLSLLFVILGLGAISSTAYAHSARYYGNYYSKTTHVFPTYLRGHWHTKSGDFGMHIMKHTMIINGDQKLIHPKYQEYHEHHGRAAVQTMTAYNVRKHYRVNLNFTNLAYNGHKQDFSCVYGPDNDYGYEKTLYRGW